jgi:hypothetical protein
MEILEDIYKEQKSQKEEIKILRAAIVELKTQVNKPSSVHLDFEKVANVILSKIENKNANAQLWDEMMITKKQIKEAVNTLNWENHKQKEKFGFKDLKSAVLFMSFFVATIISLFVWGNHREKVINEEWSSAYRNRMEKVKEQDPKTYKKYMDIINK